MIPPNGPSGFPTVSASQLRTYGAGGFRLDEQEQAKGCPRLWKAKYVEKRVPKEDGEDSYALTYGSFFHDVLFRMEEDGLSPDEALEAAFPVHADPQMWAEARKDLDAYLERGASPMDRFGTIAVETEADAVLYVDEEFGEIHYRGFIDWLGIDLDVPGVIHGVDYKTNRFPPKAEDVRGDAQLKGYDWLIRQMMHRWNARRVVMHLDAVKWREIEVAYTDDEIEAWHSWAVAVVRKMLRDDKGEPRLNPGCDWCPVRKDCPAYAKLPAVAAQMASGLKDLNDDEERLKWRDAANKVRLLLDKSVKAIDAEFQQRALAEGRVEVGQTEWALVPDWKETIDLRSLHAAMGDGFYAIASVAKGKVKEATAQWSPDALARVNACFVNTPVGTKVVRRQKDEASGG